jgi:hypothetical protein
VTIESLSLDGASVGAFDVRFSDLMVFAATGVTLDFDPQGPNASIATFTSVSVNFPGLSNLGGTVRNFGIGTDGSILLFDGFAVILDLPSAADLGFDWLPLSINTIGIIFNDVENNRIVDPLDFSLVVSASFASGALPIPMRRIGQQPGDRHRPAAAGQIPHRRARLIHPHQRLPAWRARRPSHAHPRPRPARRRRQPRHRPHRPVG